MKTALLLSDLIRIGQGQLAQARLHPQQPRAQVQHHALAHKAGLHPREQGS